MLNSILEKRTMNDNGLYNVVLEISASEYNQFYDEYSNEIAAEIMEQYLKRREDDGRPSDIQMQYDRGSNMVRIFADMHYLGNGHTIYDRY